MHVCVIVRGKHRRWRHDHWERLALGMRGVRSDQSVCGQVAGRLRGLLVAPRRGGARRWAALGASLALAFGWRWGGLVELDGDVAGGIGGAAASLRRWPGGIRVEVLAAVVAALGQAGAVERWVGLVHLFLRVALHEQIDRHHAGPL